MRDIYIILKDRFQSDFNFVFDEIKNLEIQEKESGLDDYETERLWKLKGRLEYINRQVNFFEELIEYYK